MTFVPVWMQQLQPASWNNVNFAVDSSVFSYGRRVAIHEYPYVDHPWIEDLGRDKQEVRFRGFLVGDDVYAQRDAMVTACDQAGVGTLVHPSLGSQRAYLMTAAFSESTQRGRIVDIDFDFIIADDLTARTYPVSSSDTQTATIGFATDLGGAATSDFFSQVGDVLQQGANAVNGVVQSVNMFAGLMLAPLADAARIANTVNGMSVLLDANHSYGRYVNGNVSVASNVLGTVATGLSMTARTAAGVDALVTNAVYLRNDVSNAVIGVANLASSL